MSSLQELFNQYKKEGNLAHLDTVEVDIAEYIYDKLKSDYNTILTRAAERIVLERIAYNTVCKQFGTTPSDVLTVEEIKMELENG